jgi:hypothetical protein
MSVKAFNVHVILPWVRLLRIPSCILVHSECGIFIGLYQTNSYNQTSVQIQKMQCWPELKARQYYIKYFNIKYFFPSIATSCKRAILHLLPLIYYNIALYNLLFRVEAIL